MTIRSKSISADSRAGEPGASATSLPANVSGIVLVEKVIVVDVVHSEVLAESRARCGIIVRFAISRHRCRSFK